MFTSKILELKKEIENYKSSAIIVEGLKDKKQLLKIGFENVFDISGKYLEDLVKKIKLAGHNSAVILTDLDREGWRIAKRLFSLLQHNDIKVDLLLRHKIKSLFKIRQIEELSSFTKLSDNYGEINSIHNKAFNRNKFITRQKNRK